MSYYPTQRDIDALAFPEKVLYTKILLLNDNFQTIYEMKYEFISGQLSTNVDSDIRNTFSMTLGVIDKNVGIEEDKLLWINRFVKVFVGVKVPFPINELYNYDGINVVKAGYDSDTLWYDKGIFVMTDYNYSPQTAQLNVNCSDLVCRLNGEVGGALEGLETIIYEEDKWTIREAIIETLTKRTPFTKYNIVDMPKLIPHDLEFSSSDTVWTILTKLRDLYAGYEMFFDTDGTFVCKQVSTLDSDPVVLDDSILQYLYISETDNGVLKDIRNVSRVWGKCLDTDYFTEKCEYDEATNTYKAHFWGIALEDDDGTKALPTSTKFAVKMPKVNTKDAPKIAIYNAETEGGTETLVGTYDITDSLEKTVSKDFFLADSSFVFRYRRKSMYVLGQYQITAINKLRNTEPTEEEKKADIEKHGCDYITYTVIPNSPFAIERIGERLKVCSGGEYDDIQAIDDCITRAEYETWLSAKVVYTVSLEMIYIPWLQGNEKLRFTLSATGEVKDWVVQSISTSYPYGTMSLSLTEFSPLYNFEVEEEIDSTEEETTDNKEGSEN